MAVVSEMPFEYVELVGRNLNQVMKEEGKNIGIDGSEEKHQLLPRVHRESESSRAEEEEGNPMRCQEKLLEG